MGDAGVRGFVVGVLVAGEDIVFERGCGEGVGVWVRDCDGVGYVGERRMMEGAGGEGRLGGWERWERNGGRLVVRWGEGDGVWEGAVETRVEGVAVAMSFLCAVGVLQMRVFGGGVRMVVVEREIGEGRVRMERRVAVALGVFLRWVLARERGVVREEGCLGVEWLFKAVGRKVGDSDADADMSSSSGLEEAIGKLKSVPRGYQRRAVAWMLEREIGMRGDKEVGGAVEEPWVEWKSDEEMELEGVKLAGRIVFNPTTGAVYFGEEGPSAEEARATRFEGAGGMLCCEMGLGKTLQVIGLILAHPRCPSDGDANDVLVPRPRAIELGHEVTCLECKRATSRRNIMGEDGRGTEPEGRRHRKARRSVPCQECGLLAHAACARLGAARVENYVCQPCCAKSYLPSGDSDALLKSTATLVVVPSLLLKQWVEELKRHGPDDLDVVVFDGLGGASGYVALHRLVRADVVLTTYDALRSDMYVVAHMRSTRKFRNEKRFRATPTPLLSIEWWRVCLDEAQMVESRVSQQAIMARSLSARYRWCVTGTPVRKEISELTPLLAFLRIEAFDDYQQWEDQLVHPAVGGLVTDRERLGYALRKFMWRTNKCDVEGTELCLPPQTVEVVRVEFGVVERYFYSSVLQDVRDDVQRRIGVNLRHGAGDVSARSLQELRQACVHPQIGALGRRLLRTGRRSRGYRLNGGISKPRERHAGLLVAAQERLENPLTMDEVLESMVGKARLECEEAQRGFVASCNGLAGVLLLQNTTDSLTAAVKTYRSCLALEENNRTLYRMDPIQKLHILHNLKDSFVILEERSASAQDVEVARALNGVAARNGKRERELDAEIERGRTVYINDARNRLEFAMKSFQDAMNATDELGTSLLDGDTKAGPSSRSGDEPCTGWWSLALGMVLEKGHPEVFMDRVVHGLLENQRIWGEDDFSDSLASKLHSFGRMEDVISEGLQAIEDARKAMVQRLGTLPGAVEPTRAQIRESGLCPFCREIGVQGGEKCTHCREAHLINDYEGALYNVRGRKSREEHRKYLGILNEQARGGEGGDDLWEDDPRRWQNGRSQSRPDAEVTAVVRSTMRPRGVKTGIVQTARGPSELERVMETLRAVVRSYGDDATRDRTETWFKMLNACKKELETGKAAFDAQRELLAELDELEQSLQRLCLIEDGFSREHLTDFQKTFTVTRSMLSGLHEEFLVEKAAGEAVMATKKSNLIYLSSLVSRNADNIDSTGPSGEVKKCPICLMEIREKFGVYGCGHRFCSECVSLLIGRMSRTGGSGKVACPTCRRETRIAEIQFASLFVGTRSSRPGLGSEEGGRPGSTLDASIEPRGNAGPPSLVNDAGIDEVAPVEDALGLGGPTPTAELTELFPRVYGNERESTFCDATHSVSGSHLSAKVSAVVRVLKSISTKDPLAKTLVFSQWSEVLGIVASALRENEIDHTHLGIAGIPGHSLGKRQRSSEAPTPLELFKHSLTTNVLLLPLSKGAAGLNIVEATHVFLIEPSLNPAIEAQAVSRVHRISQTKPTFVHRFIVDGSVEDRVRRIAVGREKTAHTASGEVVTVEDVQDLLG